MTSSNSGVTLMEMTIQEQAAMLCSAMASERAMRAGYCYAAIDIADHLGFSDPVWRLAWDVWWRTGVGLQSEQWAEAECLLRTGVV